MFKPTDHSVKRSWDSFCTLYATWYGKDMQCYADGTAGAQHVWASLRWMLKTNEQFHTGD